jgi:vacuolar-type H+-ATPase subunit I/STV1
MARRMAATIDTLRLAKRFKEVKLSEEQAELLAETFREAHAAELGEVATKADLALLRADMTLLREELGHRIDEVESKLGRRIDEVESKLGRRIDGLEAKIDGLEARLTVRLGGMLAAGIVLVGALVAIF